ncbi:MAG: FHA domain-containing protein [Caldilinea sp. CFX5]|nr:FHA domain-containing protein [Caldilinea sp. CFX5]
MHWLYATFMPSLETYGVALLITALTTLLLLRHHALHAPGGRGRPVLRSTLPQEQQTPSRMEGAALPQLYQPAKALLLLARGNEAWLPYLIPLYTATTRLGNDVGGGAGKGDMAFELLSSLSIDEEHCVIQQQNGQFMIFDRARFNNTLVDRAPVPPEGCRLTTGTRITLGAVEYIFVANRGR